MSAEVFVVPAMEAAIVTRSCRLVCGRPNNSYHPVSIQGVYRHGWWYQWPHAQCAHRFFKRYLHRTDRPSIFQSSIDNAIVAAHWLAGPEAMA